MKNYLTNLLTKQNYIFIIISVLYTVFTFFTDHLIFNFNNLNIFNYISCKALLFILFFCALKFGEYLYEKKLLFKYFKNFLIYFIPIFLILLLVWPGIWYGNDNFNFYNYSLTANYFHELNYLSSIFYILGFMIFPIPSGAIILQSITMSCVISYIVTRLYDITKSKSAYLMYVPFFLLHTIFYILYANRPVIVGILYLLLVSTLVLDKMSNTKLSIQKYTILTTLTALLTTWRKEQIYLAVAVPLLIFITYNIKFKKINIAKIFIPIIIASILVYLPQTAEYSTKEKNFYRNLPTYLTPLSWILNQPLQGDEIDNALAKMDKVIDIEQCKLYVSLNDCAPMYHPEIIRDFSKEDIKDFQSGFIYVISHNPNLFLKSKYLTFKASTLLIDDFFSSIDLYSSNEDTLYESGNSATKTIIGNDLRNKVLTILEGRYENTFFKQIYKITSNLYVPLIGLAILFIISIFKRKLFYFLTFGMILGQAFIIFMTAPASYFMYYFYAFLTGWFFIILFICKAFSNKKKLK